MEELFELDDQLPIVGRHILLEVSLQSINRVSCQNRCNLISVIKVATIGNGGVPGNFHGNTTVGRLSDLQRLAIELDRFDFTYTRITLLRDAERCADSELSSLHSQTNNDGIFHVEDSALDHLAKSREDCLGTVLLLSLFSAFLDILGELVKQVINDVCSEDSNAIVICILLSIWVNLHVES